MNKRAATGGNRGAPGETRSKLIAMLKTKPGPTRALATAMGVSVQCVYISILEMRAKHRPVFIQSYVRSPDTGRWEPAYAWGNGVDADKGEFERRESEAELPVVRICGIQPHRDWAVAAMFGARGMADNRMENRA